MIHGQQAVYNVPDTTLLGTQMTALDSSVQKSVPATALNLNSVPPTISNNVHVPKSPDLDKTLDALENEVDGNPLKEVDISEELQDGIEVNEDVQYVQVHPRNSINVSGSITSLQNKSHSQSPGKSRQFVQSGKSFDQTLLDDMPEGDRSPVQIMKRKTAADRTMSRFLIDHDRCLWCF